MNMISKLSILFFVLLAFGFITGDTYKLEGEKHLANIKMEKKMTALNDT